MKAYTLRLEDQLLTILKEIGFREKKSLKSIIIEALQEKIFKRGKSSQNLKEKKLMEKAARLASRLNDQQIIASIREDRLR
jgi:predicted DNA-binding ribbon-helix-helix protein